MSIEAYSPVEADNSEPSLYLISELETGPLQDLAQRTPAHSATPIAPSLQGVPGTSLSCSKKTRPFPAHPSARTTEMPGSRVRSS